MTWIEQWNIVKHSSYLLARWTWKFRKNTNRKSLMWFSCKTSFDTVPNRVKLMIKVMAFVALVLYLTLVLCQNVSGYQDLKVSFVCILYIRRFNSIKQILSVGVCHSLRFHCFFFSFTYSSTNKHPSRRIWIMIFVYFFFFVLNIFMFEWHLN